MARNRFSCAVYSRLSTISPIRCRICAHRFSGVIGIASFEGIQSRKEKEELYLKGIEFLTPVAITILEEANNLFLQRTGEIRVVGPKNNSSGELETRFELNWPVQRAAYNTHASREPLQPVCIVVNYSQNFLHPHLSGSTAGYWPFQVTSEADADRQKGILSAIVEWELHQRIFETDWRILPVSDW